MKNSLSQYFLNKSCKILNSSNPIKNEDKSEQTQEKLIRLRESFCQKNKPSKLSFIKNPSSDCRSSETQTISELIKIKNYAS